MSKEITFSRETMAIARTMLDHGRFEGMASFEIGCDLLYSLKEDLQGSKASFDNVAGQTGKIANVGCWLLKTYARRTEDFRLQSHFKKAESSYKQALTISAQTLNL